MTVRKGGRPRHRPQRSCVVCRRKMDKRCLTRIVSRAQGLLIDPGGKAEGRGAYLCRQSACWESAARGTALARSLSVKLGEADRQRLWQGRPET
ncbi:MAG: YlxR family protein [Anaerolineaceae bacterium]|nr:YlxR family protein [Anaerolineaceae bacterium]MDE0329322.1 YlxR family protein [Anaerolineaceae bacterium]